MHYELKYNPAAGKGDDHGVKELEREKVGVDGFEPPTLCL